ncbi:MAG: fibronectin type III protein, partial [uncultured bacterium]
MKAAVKNKSEKGSLISFVALILSFLLMEMSIYAVNCNLHFEWTYDNANTPTLQGYRIYQGATQIAQIANSATKATDLVVDVVEGSNTFTMTAYDTNNNESLHSNEFPLDFQDPPAYPTGVASSNIGQTSITVSWAANTESDLAGYRIYRSTGVGAYSRIASTTTSVRTYTNTGLTPSTTYNYKVIAYDTTDANNDTAADFITYLAACSSISATTSANAVPAVLTGVAINDSANNSLVISWNRNNESDLAGYNIYRSIAGAAYVRLNSTVIAPAALSYTNTGLTQGTSYSYQVCAIDNASQEGARTTVSAVPGRPVTPQGLAAASGNRQVTLSWTSNKESDLSGYNVYLNSGSGSSTNVALNKTYTKNKVAGNGALLNGITTGFVDFDSFDQGGNFVVNLGQTYNISKIGLKFFDVLTSQRYYRYTVEVSANGTTYTQVINKSS